MHSPVTTICNRLAAGNLRVRLLVSGLALISLILPHETLPWVTTGQAYNLPEIRHGRYQSDEVGLMAIERETIATELSTFVINHHREGVINGEPAVILLAERLLALALNLHSRNRTAMIADFQFRRKVAPQAVEEGYDPAVLANLLVTRAKFLREQANEIDRELTGFFLAAAMEIDPTNEEAVYQHLLLRNDGYEVSWELLTGRRERGSRSTRD